MNTQNNTTHELIKDMRDGLAITQGLLADLEATFTKLVVELDKTPEGRAQLQEMARLSNLNTQIARMFGRG